jgi:photosystem II stability/assembly factor-like uncharacterized protein
MALACVSPNGRAEYPTDAPVTRLLVGTIKGVHVLERTETSSAWRLADTCLEGRQISSLVFHAGSGQVFAGIAGHGLYASADQGRTWQLRASGLRIDHVFAMAVDGRQSHPVLYAGTLPPALFRSTDLGQSWQELSTLNEIPDADKWNFRAPPGAPHVKNIAFHPTERTTLFVCIEQGGLMKTTDAGQTWSELFAWQQDDTFYRDAHRLAIQRSDPDVMYLASGDGLCKTTDGGRAWERLTTGTYKVGYPDALFIDPDDDQVVYIGGAGGHPGTWDAQTARASFARGSQGGHRWEELREGLPNPVRGNIEAISMAYGRGHVAFYAGTAVGEVFASEDRGQHWQQIAQLPPISKAGHYRRFLSPEERAQAERELMAQR